VTEAGDHSRAARPHGFLRTAILFEGGLVILALALGWLFQVQPFGSVRVTARAVSTGLLATLPPLLALTLLLRSNASRLSRLVREVERLIGPLFEGASVGAVALVSILAGVGEESLFRGVLQPALGSVAGPWMALVVVSAVFGLVHFVTATYAFLAGLIGLYLGWLFLWTGNLLVPIVVHALYDFVALTILVRRVRSGAGDGPEPLPAAGAPARDQPDVAQPPL
jgi:membrane protease YdiL (CAAX protease family)